MISSSEERFALVEEEDGVAHLRLAEQTSQVRVDVVPPLVVLAP